MRVGIFSKRERSEGVHPDQWDDRKLPKPHASEMVGRSRRDRRTSYKTWQDETTLELQWNDYELIEKRLDKLDVGYRTAEEQEKRKLVELEAIRNLRGYLSYHVKRLNCRERLAEGRSIGSGQVTVAASAITGACKNLIGKR